MGTRNQIYIPISSNQLEMEEIYQSALWIRLSEKL